MKDNIIRFKNKSKLTEAEINGLFLGFVKLIKKLAVEEAESSMPKDLRLMQEKVQELNLRLSQREREIDFFKEENRQLKSKIKVKNMRILQLSCLSAKRICENKA